MFNVLALIAVHEVPLVLNSIRFDTPSTVSLCVSRARLVGNVSPAPGTSMLLIFDDGAVTVALFLTKTVVAALPNMLRGMLEVLICVHVSPSSRLYSIALETPIITSVVPLNTAFGAAPRAGAVTAYVADANAAFVALMRT
jgi:hypothetical protein